MVELVCDIDRTGGVDGHPGWIAELGFVPGPVGGTGRTGTGQGGDRTFRANFADAVVAGVPDIDGAGGIDGNTTWTLEFGASAGPVGGTARTRAGQDGDHTC